MEGPLLWFTTILLCLAHGLAKRECVPEYNTSSSREPGKINIHLIPHTHDDTGWLKTVDQYYYGSRQDIQLAGVQYVLDTVIYALEKNPHRRFSYAEMSFFTRWWDEQTEDNQETVKKLVADGRLNFLNGGWVQHDEAASHYVAMIDQTSRGHRFLEETFGYRPRVGWQIDPFGHSSTQAALLAGYLGFDALFFGRSDYQDLELRKKAKQLEFLWRGAKSFGKDADVFTGSFPTGNYGPPGGFYFDWGNWDPPIQDTKAYHHAYAMESGFAVLTRKCGLYLKGSMENAMSLKITDSPAESALRGSIFLQDNVCLTELNVEERVEDFVRNAEEYSELYQDKDIFWPMGTDFTYSNAFTWFKNLDKLIHYVNKDGRVNAFYSTPEEYVKTKHSQNLKWPLKTDDFFPYADCETCYWTGYFTSRPASKGYIKAGTSYLQVTRQLELLTGTPGSSEHLEEAVSLLQHHDSITGTEKQHVANDYHKRLAKGWNHASRFVSKALSHLVYNTQSTAAALKQPAEDQSDLLLLLQQCPQLNVSVCAISLSSSQKSDSFLVVVYNSLAWHRIAPVRVPITADDKASWHVTDPDGNGIESQLVPVSDSTKDVQKTLHEGGALPDLNNAASEELAFIAELPPLGYKAFTLSKKPSVNALLAKPSVLKDFSQDERWNQSSGADDAIVFDQGESSLSLSASTGRITSLKSKSGKEWDVDIEGAYYQSHNSSGGVASGAYIFRPDGQYRNAGPLKTVTVHGPVLTEVRFKSLDFLDITVRVWKGLAPHYAEVEWTAGPIPISDDKGKEVVIQYKSALKSGDTFQTDSNGREMLTRKLDYRPTWDLKVTQPVAGNYYPLTAAIAIQGENKAGGKQDELAILVDRAQGGTSLKEGEIEIMVHRRTLLDDVRGVNEPLNETVATCRFCDSPGLVARGIHYLAFNRDEDAALHRRELQQLINDPVLLSFGPRPSANSEGPFKAEYSAMAQNKEGLPRNVQLLTAKLLEDDRVLLRLAHLFQVDEGELAKPVDVAINDLFDDITFDKLEEYGLAGAQPLDKIDRLKFREGKAIHNGEVEGVHEYTRSAAFACRESCADSKLTITLRPMEIRTFIGTLSKDSSSVEHPAVFDYLS